MKTITILMLISVILLLGFWSCGRDQAYHVRDGAKSSLGSGVGPVGPVPDSLIFIDGPGARVEYTIVVDSTRASEDDPPVGPESVVFTLTSAYQTRDVNLLSGLLSDNFRFYPSHAPGMLYPVPVEPSWDKSQEISIHANLFDLSRPGLGFPAIDHITCQIECVDKKPSLQADSENVSLICIGRWGLWSFSSEKKPVAVQCSGSFTLLVSPDPDDRGAWKIEAWYEEVGEARSLYVP